MKRQITIILIILTLGFSQRINLNSATLEEFQSLELTDDQIESILDYRIQLGYIHNIYCGYILTGFGNPEYFQFDHP